LPPLTCHGQDGQPSRLLDFVKGFPVLDRLARQRGHDVPTAAPTCALARVAMPSDRVVPRRGYDHLPELRNVDGHHLPQPRQLKLGMVEALGRARNSWL
jgi:hypothetical protein